MREEPDGAALLEAAYTLLRGDILLKALPADKRQGALMISNAISIAMRQFNYGELPEREELQSLRELFGANEDCMPECAMPLRSGLVILNRQLAECIRSGAADPGTPLHAKVLAHLRRAANQRVLESNPRAHFSDTAGTG